MRRWYRTISWFIFGSLILLTVGVAIYLRHTVTLVTSHLEAIVTSAIGGEGRFRVVLKRADASRPGLVTLQDLTIALPNRPSGEPPLLHVDSIRVLYNWKALLRTRKYPQAHVVKVEIVSPTVILVRDRMGRWSQPPPAPRRVPPPKAKAPPFTGTVLVSGGKLVVRDAYIRPGKWEVRELSDIEAKLDARDSPVMFLSAMARGGESLKNVSLTGRFDTDQETQALDLSASDLDVSSLLAYLPLPQDFRLQGGRGDIDLTALRGPDHLDLLGTAHMEDASMEWQKVSLRRLSGDVRFIGPSAWLDLKGDILDEPVQGTGLLYNWQSPRLDVNLKGRTSRFNRLERVVPQIATLRKSVHLFYPVDIQAQVEGPATNPVFSIRLAAPALQVKQGRYKEKIEAITLQARYASKILEIQSLNARAFQGTVRLSGQANFREKAPSAFLLAEARGLRLKGVPLPFPLHPAGATDVGLSLTWTNNKPEAYINVKVSEGKFLKTEFANLQASLRWKEKDLLIRGARAQAAGGWIDARGTISLEGGIDLNLNALDVDLKELTHSYSFKAEGLGYLHGRLVGKAGSPTLIADVQALEGRMEGLSFDIASGKLEASPEEIRFIDSRVIKSPGWAQLNGDLELHKGKVGQIKVTGQAFQLPVSGLLHTFNVETSVLDGILSGDFTLEGSPGQLVAQGPAMLRAGKVAEFLLPTLQGQFRWEGKSLYLDDVRGSANGEKMALAGRFDLASGFDFSFRASGVPLLRVEPYLVPYIAAEGTSSIEGTISGPPDRPRVDIQALSKDPKLNGHTFGKIETVLRWEDGHLIMDSLQLSENGSRYQAGPMDFDFEGREVQGRAQIRNGRASTIVAMMKASPFMNTPAGQKALKVLGGLPRNTEGEIDANLEIEGDMTDPKVAFDLQEATDIQVGELVKIEKGTARVLLENGAFQIRQFSVSQGDAVVEASGILDPLGSISLDIDAHNLDASLIRPLVPKRYPVEGLAEISMLISGQTQSPNVDASVTITDARLLGVPFDTVQSQKISLEGRKLDVGEIVFVQNSRQARIFGTAPVPWATKEEKAEVPYDLHAEIKKQNLDFLPELFPKVVADADGSLDARLNIMGAGEHRAMDGWFRVADGKVLFQRLDAPLKNIVADLSFTGSTISVDRFSGESDTGSFQGSGTVDVSELPETRLDLKVALNALHLAGQNLIPFYQERFTGSLTTEGPLAISGTLERPQVSGTVVMHDVRALLPAQVARTTAQSEGELEGGPVFDPVFDIRVVVGRNAWIQSQRLRALAGGEVSIGGQFSDPRLRGFLTLEKGTIFFPTARFKLVSGDINFSYNPERGTQAYLTAHAQTTMRTRAAGSPPGAGRTQEYRIDLTLAGPLDSPLKIQASSSPPFLSEREIYALLLRQDQVAGILSGGQDVERRLGEELGQLFTSATVPLLFGPVESYFAEALQLEEFALEYDWRQPLQLRISKRLNDRFLFTYLRSLGSRLLDTRYERYLFRLTYELTNRLQLSWDIDERSNQSLTLEGVIRF